MSVQTNEDVSFNLHIGYVITTDNKSKDSSYT